MFETNVKVLVDDSVKEETLNIHRSNCFDLTTSDVDKPHDNSCINMLDMIPSYLIDIQLKQLMRNMNELNLTFEVFVMLMCYCWFIYYSQDVSNISNTSKDDSQAVEVPECLQQFDPGIVLIQVV